MSATIDARDAATESRIDALTARLHARHPVLIDLGLDRIRATLDRLGNPELRLPPVIHVAGTNGKGSTCAFLRAMAEAAGLSVHVYTSPHLVRFNERIRIAGRLVENDALYAALDRVEEAAGEDPITVFEVITAAALLLFAETPADLCVLEVGLGGRGDATNVVPRPAGCVIAPVSIDHQDFLGETLAEIATEKAGIIKPGVPVIVGPQPPAALAAITSKAEALGAPMLLLGRDFDAADLPPPRLPGPHQRDNAAIAAAAIRASGLPVPENAIRAGVGRAVWAARLQRLHGRLTDRLPSGWELWLDGGHNEGAAAVLATVLDGWRDRPVHLVVGMKQSKNAAAFLAPLIPRATTLWAVAEPRQHLAWPVDAIVAASSGVARPGPTVAAALDQISHEPATNAAPARVLICGSLYLAGEVLRADGTIPD